MLRLPLLFLLALEFHSSMLAERSFAERLVSFDDEPAAATEAAPSECGCNVCSTCTCEDSCGGLLGGWLVPSDPCFSEFISPITNPTFFEDPRTLTELRFIYARHKVPADALGGTANAFLLQARAALTENLSVIATKDGFVTSTNPLIDDGWLDVAAGLKYNLFSDAETQELLSAGVTFELPVGSRAAQQGNGDGLFHLFLTGGTEFGNNNHWISGSGFLLPADRSAESTIWYWSNHFDRKLGGSNWYALAEVNWFHYLGAGDAFDLAPIEGGDLFNLGTVGVAGNDIVTGALGAKYKPSSHLELGAAIEFPVTERRDVLDNRLYFDCIVRY
jgi:hypothetical protein